MLKGDVVTLREIREGDLPTLYETLMDPDTWHQTEDAPLWPMTFAAYQELHTKQATDERTKFAIEVDGQLAGWCALDDIDQLARHAGISIALGKSFRGQGYGRDAIGVLLDYAFNKRNLNRVHLEPLATNEAALKCYAACGFVEEGRLREHVYVAGQYVDMVVMAVLRTEWLAAQDGR